MKLLSSGPVWPSTFVIFLFCQSILAYPRIHPTSNDTSTDPDDSSENSADSEEVTITLDDHSDHSVNSGEEPLSSREVVLSRSENKIKDEKSAYEYLKKYGYLIKRNNDRPSSIINLSESLKKMQKFAGIPVSGKLDDATKNLMKRERCGLPDNVETNSSFGKRFNAITRWRRNRLTYRIFGYPTNSYNLQNNNRVDTLIETAFKDWSSVANVHFRKTSSDFNDIKIDFLRGNHGDGFHNKFDGPGSTLAHAYFPEDGRIHFDDDETWTDGYISDEAPNLRQVATHEIGHILGLNHSDVMNAIMYPYFSYHYNFKLDADDIDGAVYLYGRNQVEATTRNPFFPFSSTTRRTTTTTRRPTTRNRFNAKLRPTPRSRFTLRNTPKFRFTPPALPLNTPRIHRNENMWWH